LGRPIIETIDEINTLSNERLGLMRLAGKRKLMEGEWERCWRTIPRLLATLWNDRRCERAAENKHRVFVVARGDVFADYLDRAHTDGRGLDWDELDSFEIQPMPVFWSKVSIPKLEQYDPDQLLVAAMKLAAVELKVEGILQKRANLRRWMKEAVEAREVEAIDTTL
jgi:hypothetical protein